MNVNMTRRAFALPLAAAVLRAQTPVPRTAGDAPMRMRTRALYPADTPAPAGLHHLKVRSWRDTQVYIPEAAARFAKVPVVLSLHGATQGAEHGIALLRGEADTEGFMIVAPWSRESTWDIEDASESDFENVDRSLATSFDLRTVDPGRIAIAGFSDGATYSLAVGLANGDLFHAVMAFSSGYLTRTERVGKPPVFLSHGTEDPIFPIAMTGRAVARALKGDGYDVTMHEFAGRHALPADVATDAMRWLKAVPALTTG